jgi:hypothetical protein
MRMCREYFQLHIIQPHRRINYFRNIYRAHKCFCHCGNKHESQTNALFTNNYKGIREKQRKILGKLIRMYVGGPTPTGNCWRRCIYFKCQNSNNRVFTASKNGLANSLHGKTSIEIVKKFPKVFVIAMTTVSNASFPLDDCCRRNYCFSLVMSPTNNN